MNPATLFLAAYKELGGRPDITAAALHAEADNMYTIWRNCQIGQWATAAHAKHGTNLLKHEEKLLDMVEQVDEEYYGWLASGDVWGEDDDQVWAPTRTPTNCLAQIGAVSGRSIVMPR